MCRTHHIKPCVWLSNINFGIVSFHYDPWYFKTPLAYKPAFINMEVDLDHITIPDLLIDSHWNMDILHYIFGDHLNHFVLLHGTVSFDIEKDGSRSLDLLISRFLL